MFKVWALILMSSSSYSAPVPVIGYYSTEANCHEALVKTTVYETWLPGQVGEGSRRLTAFCVPVELPWGN